MGIRVYAEKYEDGKNGISTMYLWNNNNDKNL